MVEFGHFQGKGNGIAGSGGFVTCVGCCVDNTNLPDIAWLGYGLPFCCAYVMVSVFLQARKKGP